MLHEKPLCFPLRLFLFGLLSVITLLAQPPESRAQDKIAETAAQPAIQPFIPVFWDNHSRLDKPDLKAIKLIRIVTDDDYPPFTMPGHDGTVTGFSVELAREACHELNIPCSVQVMPFENLLESLNADKGDIAIAAFPADKDLRNRFAVTLPYFKNPGRFIIRKDRKPPSEIKPSILAKGTKISVIAGSTHEAFLKAFFPQAEIIAVPDFITLAQNMKTAHSDYAFLDGVRAAFWINGSNSENCCRLIGEPYLESRYFGEGLVFVARKNNLSLQLAFDHAFRQLHKNGKYAELYLRFFPVNPY
jgi:ABC-type amino acid transport/signal transduction systems, periplasmic component/domain